MIHFYLIMLERFQLFLFFYHYRFKYICVLDLYKTKYKENITLGSGNL